MSAKNQSIEGRLHIPDAGRFSEHARRAKPKLKKILKRLERRKRKAAT